MQSIILKYFFRTPKDMHYDEEAAEIDRRRDQAAQNKPNQSKLVNYPILYMI